LDISDTVVVVTGGGAGLGMALCRDFASRNAAGVVVVDLDEEAAAKAAAEVGGVAVVADVGRERELGRVVELAREAYGRVDIFVSNAGTVANGDPFTDDDVWRNLWQVNVMSGVYAARLVLPEMLERGSGHLAFTASSTGLTLKLRARSGWPWRTEAAASVSRVSALAGCGRR
jgi:NADP-dependent 3-hydroxy acid dehydrogenase YdfG